MNCPITSNRAIFSPACLVLSVTAVSMESANGAPKDNIAASYLSPPNKLYQPLPSNNMVWITPEPTMPLLAVQDVVTGATKLPTQMSWQFRSTYSAKSTRSGDARSFPSSGFSAVAYNKPWYPPFGSDFFGGDAAFNFSDNVILGTRTFQFKIRGQTPTRDAVKNYVASQPDVPAANYARFIFRHESFLPSFGTGWNQFFPGGTKAGEPVLGSGDAWGMAGLDYGGSGKSASTMEVWNWHENLNSAIRILREKRATANDYFAAIKKKYPKQWEEPPAYLVPKTHTTLTALDATTIAQYRKWTVSFKDDAGFYHYSCWNFTPANASGKRWNFVPDDKNYLYLVISEGGG